jgi:inosine-uridine nucleoside N-ribohydrolase
MTRSIALVGIAGLLLLGACTSAEPDDAAISVVVDTDMGQDDAMAIMYLLQHPDVRVEAITVSGTGLAHCDAGVGNALALLEISGAPPGIPVACGPEEPLPGTMPGSGAFPDEWRAAADELYGLELPETDRAAAEQAAPELLASAIRDAGGPVRVLTLGPLTNLALALREEPDLLEDVQRIVVMGGAVGVPGNAIENSLAEFNIWIDPVAANEVLDSGAPVDLVPLDATNQVPVTPFFADALRRHHVTPEADTVLDLFEAQPELVEGGYSFWDPLAAAVLTDRTLSTFEDRRITVLEGKPTIQGWTVNDSDGASIRLAVDADALAFERAFLNTLNGDEVVTTTRPEPVASATISSTACEWRSPTTLPAGMAAVEWEFEGQPGSSGVIIVVGFEQGRTVEDFVAWLDEEGGIVRQEPPGWIRAEAFLDGSAGALAPVPLEPGPHAVACADQATGRVELIARFDVTP